MLRLTLISLGYFLAVFWIAGCGGAGSVESAKPPSAEQVTVPSLSEAKNTGDYWNANGLKMPFRWCSAGSYSMGLSESEKDPIDALDNTNDPVHVQLTGFWLGEREVTQAEWKAVMGSTVEEQRAKAAAERLWGVGDRFPIYFVTWRESSEFCRRLTQSERAAGRLPEGWIYALPTEAQWEYACRAGTTTLTNLGDSVGSDRINYSPDHSFPGAAPGPHRNSTVEVGSLPANA